MSCLAQHMLFTIPKGPFPKVKKWAAARPQAKWGRFLYVKERLERK